MASGSEGRVVEAIGDLPAVTAVYAMRAGDSAATAGRENHATVVWIAAAQPERIGFLRREGSGKHVTER